ncbi:MULTISPECIES: hypothetical protein [Brucella/Ochrobactrum group]|uniref:helix-turn-helix transcriptional regulator n=1 Tax=Ochrobactrum sp. BTU2 TaxID=2856166 RepID=UPI001E3B1EC5|nr:MULTISPECIES: hypothetical protein [Brucella/Ochrobactrum group]UGQ22577.1 hypothetical protein LRL11_01360 [Brucella anthropi]
MKSDPYSYPPRGMNREEAARYIGVGTTKFDELVKDGRMPKGKRIDGRVVWDRYKLDASFTDLPDNDPRPPQEAKSKRSYDLSITTLGKREQDTLAELSRYGVGVKVSRREIKGCGGQTEDRLTARGFIETFPNPKFPERVGGYVLNEAGMQAWKAIMAERLFT